jgi:hypothetical protein
MSIRKLAIAAPIQELEISTSFELVPLQVAPLIIS